MSWILAAHIAVLGYWLGSELVINSTYRFFCRATDMPFAQRDRLMDHIMHVDQHVRYALVFQMALGVMLAAGFGYIPGGNTVMAVAALAGGGWLTFVEAVHRLRKQPIGRTLAAIDRGSRYVLMAVLIAVAFSLIGADWALPLWLRWKLAAFAAVMACGVGIRLALVGHFRIWGLMAQDGPTPEREAIIQRTYVRATTILVLLWLFIAAMTALSIGKPL